MAAILASALGYLPLRVFGDGGLQRARRLERELGQLKLRVSEARASNERMRAEVQALGGDMRMIERVARDELGLVRPGEVVYQFE